MHGAPKLMIIAKREAAGDLMPDFSGPGYHEARKCAIHGESEKMDPVGDGDMDLRETLMDISKKLEKASAMHQEQSEALRALAGNENRRYSGPRTSDEDKDSDNDKQSSGRQEPSGYGSAIELK